MNVSTLPGKPDFVFARARLVVFVDGDFWHGRDWKTRRQKLLRGSNADYWVRKIEGNMKRDRRNRGVLRREGWSVLRVWESSVLFDAKKVALAIQSKMPI